MSDPRVAWLDERFDRSMEELAEFVAIPSVSIDGEHDDDVERAARWLADKLRSIGLDGVTIHPAGGHPIVTAEWLHAPGQPTVLLYGHFDVQPADPALWGTEPFEPIVVGDRMLGRGATDCKGALMMAVTAIESALAVGGRLPVNVKLIFEGQEEMGSPTLPDWIRSHLAWLRTDFAYSTDSVIADDDRGMVWKGLKGAVAIGFELRGADQRVHSGVLGGVVPNAAAGVATVLASLHQSDGRVAVDGFYDEVEPISEEERADLAELPWDDGEQARAVGLDALVGEEGFDAPEILALRPTLEVTGVASGIAGFSAIVPNRARAWLLCRLVADQDMATIGELVVAHIRRHVPIGLHVDVEVRPMCSPVKFASDSPSFAMAVAVHTDVFGRPPAIGYVGGSVTFISHMRDIAGIDVATFGFQREDEHFHAPDEFLRLGDARLGQRGFLTLLDAHRDALAT